MTTLRWRYGRWVFVQPKHSSFLAVYRDPDLDVPYDMPPRARPHTQQGFEASCVAWLIATVPDRLRRDTEWRPQHWLTCLPALDE